MSFKPEKNELYRNILKEELVLALGCTEPIAIAYASAKARETLGQFPQKIVVRCSGNIIKNAKSVVVPNTGQLRGIVASALTGVVAGDSTKGLEVIETVSEEQISQIKLLVDKNLCDVQLIENDANLHIIVEVFHEQDQAMVEIIHTHLNICRIEKNHEVIYENMFDKDD
ncbi:MAG: serine dehydratase subunit alpha family protein, partial [Turicibacter sp.]